MELKINLVCLSGNRLNPKKSYIKSYNPKTLRSFMLKHFSPDRMILVGINVNHDDLCKWTMRAFVDYEGNIWKIPLKLNKWGLKF